MIPVRQPIQQATVEALEKEIDEVLGSSKETTLGAFVDEAYRIAREHRASEGVDADIRYCEHAYRNSYTPEERQRLGIDDGTDIFAPLTSTKCTALESWLHDIFANAEDKPWTLEPTPVPELPPELEEAVLQRVAQEFAVVGDNADPDAVAERLRELKSLAMSEAERAARRVVERMARKIEDMLNEGGFREAFAAMRTDLAIYPNAFLRGPYIEHVSVPTWRGGTMEMVRRPIVKVERIAPVDVFPSPNSTNTQDGAYVIVRKHMTASELQELAEIPEPTRFGVHKEAIEELLARYPHGFSYNQDPEGTTMAGPDEDKTYEVLIYYGYVRESTIEDFKKDRLDTVPNEAAGKVRHVECWVCNGLVLRLAEIKDGRLRPLHTTSFRPRPNEFWGLSLPMVLRQIQRVANACLRSLVMNMAVASAPLGEYDVDRLENETQIDRVEPWRLYAIVNTGVPNQLVSQPAIRFHNVDSHARELLLVYDRCEKMADDASGIPAYVIGAPQVAGAGRTLGGLALLMGNAAKGIKRVVSEIDKNIIEPLIKSCYMQLMLTEKDTSLKADAQVKARGAAGLLQRELSQARAVEVLQLLTPYAQAGLVPQQSIIYLLRDIVRSLGYPADEVIPDPGRAQELQRFLAQQQQVPGVTEPVTNAAPDVMAQLQGFGLAGAPPQPQLDGRSAPPPNPGDAENLPPEM